MGLAERRALKDFQDNHAPKLLEQVTEAMGSKPEMDIHWDTMAVDEASSLYAECWPKIYFDPLIAALKNVGRDDMGRQALQEGLKKIVITNDTDCYSGDRWATLAAGILTLDHQPITNADQVEDRTNGLVKVLEKGL